MKNDQNRNTGSFPPKGTNLLLVLIVAFLTLHLDADGQQITLDVSQEPLNQVLISMAEEHYIQVSFDDRLLSQYPITVHRSFRTPEEAIAFLLEPLPLDYEITGGVYIIFSEEKTPEKIEYRISGRVVDRLSGETLPYSHLMINGHGSTTDFNGHFSSSSSRAPVSRICG